MSRARRRATADGWEFSQAIAAQGSAQAKVQKGLSAQSCVYLLTLQLENERMSEFTTHLRSLQSKAALQFSTFSKGYQRDDESENSNDEDAFQVVAAKIKRKMKWKDLIGRWLHDRQHGGPFQPQAASPIRNNLPMAAASSAKYDHDIAMVEAAEAAEAVELEAARVIDLEA